MREPKTQPVREDWWDTDSSDWERQEPIGRLGTGAARLLLGLGADQLVGDDFAAKIRQRPLNEIKLVECCCGPCSEPAARCAATNKEGEPFVGIQIIVGGGERFHIGQQTISVGEGDLVFWNSYEFARVRGDGGPAQDHAADATVTS